MMVRQLEEELRMRMRGPSVEMQQQMEVLYNENEHLTREIAILRDTIKELELRIETQKQTLQARDESIKKLLEMLQNKGMGKEEERIMFQQMQSMAQKDHNRVLRALPAYLVRLDSIIAPEIDRVLASDGRVLRSVFRNRGEIKVRYAHARSGDGDRQQPVEVTNATLWSRGAENQRFEKFDNEEGPCDSRNLTKNMRILDVCN
ncbi:hypothetical protein P5V15_013650 [Pogonomyrmex californicus]